MNLQDMREILLARTITVIANEGLDKTTTKAIVTGTGINEAYIYRCFSDKEDLLSKAFNELDCEFVAKTMQHISVLYIQKLDYETRFRLLFAAMWNFIIGNREKCLAFIRYYYSPYFQKYSAKAHKERYKPVVMKFADVFKDEADVWMILNHILNVMLDFAVKVFHNEMPDDDGYTEHVFRVIYYSIKQYFR